MLLAFVVPALASTPVTDTQTPPKETVASALDPQCMGPTDRVLVRAESAADRSQRARYTVENRHTAALISWILGDGARLEMPIVPYQLPQHVKAPAGWAGQIVYIEESQFMNIRWNAEDPAEALAPRRLRNGFELQFPKTAAPYAPQYYPDGTKVRPIDYSALPYRAYFADGTCVWGQVRPAAK